MKWTKEEDDELCQLLEKFGPAWHEIEQNFSTPRSRNALIKRWHSKLKDDQDILSLSESEEMEPEGRMPTRSTGGSRRDAESKEAKKKSSPEAVQPLKPEVYAKSWSFKDDEDLKDVVLKNHQYDWGSLAKLFAVSKDEAILRWQKRIYPQIKLNDKVAGAVKWSKEEDSILINCEKVYPEGWEKILVFLPSRSVFSIEARLKRIYANQTVENQSALGQKPKSMTSTSAPLMSKYEFRKQIIKKIAEQKATTPRQFDSSAKL